MPPATTTFFKDLIKGDDASAEAHRKFYDEYNAVLDMDADYYLETIQTVFQEFKLVHGTWDVQGVDGRVERVRPQDIKTTALLTVEGELDDISGSGQTRAAQDLCSSIPRNNRHHLEVEGAGHYGIFSGRRWREMVYPQVRQFILDHAQPQVAKTSPAARPVKASAAPARAKTSQARSTAKREPTAAARKSPRQSPGKARTQVSAKPAVKTQWVNKKA